MGAAAAIVGGAGAATACTCDGGANAGGASLAAPYGFGIPGAGGTAAAFEFFVLIGFTKELSFFFFFFFGTSCSTISSALISLSSFSSSPLASPLLSSSSLLSEDLTSVAMPLLFTSAMIAFLK